MGKRGKIRNISPREHVLARPDTYVGDKDIAGIHLLSPTPYASHVYFHKGSGNSNQVINSDLTGMTSFIFSVIYITDS